MYNRLPDGAFLRAGGLLDQPAGLWMEVQHCGYVAGILKDSRAEGFKASEAFDTKRWDDRDVKMFERIQKIREEMAGHG